jgi:membrane-associated protein
VNLESALQQIVSFTATLDPRMAALLFVLCSIGEFGFSIPYVLESIWLLVGFQLGHGVLSPLHLAVLWLAAQCGRQVGSMGLYRVARFGTPSLTRFYNKLRLSRFVSRIVNKSGAVNHINLSSPFSVAYGRLFGMRIPMVLVLAVKRRLGMLSLGVLLSSLVWDTLYISLGVIFGSTTAIKPSYMFLASLAGLTVIYLVTFIIRILIRRSRPVSNSVNRIPTLPTQDKIA